MDVAALPKERQKFILDRLQNTGRVIAAEIAAEVGATEDTVRRDLRHLAKEGLCQRVYGGALTIHKISTPLHVREDENRDRKRRLALRAVQLLRTGDVVFIDAGSTNTEIARLLPDNLNLRVITNAPAVANAILGRSGIEVDIIGGHLDRTTGGSLGARAVSEVRSIRPSICFPGICALDSELGLTAFDPEDAFMKANIIASSARVVAVATREKIATCAPYVVSAADKITDLVVEAGVEEDTLTAYAKIGLAIQVVDGLKDE
ncbi:DeoR/GlpR family DNA-binding transcription regulator [Phyllobacterium pellucidum]|uniref:DeoR/GlpR family DNA-binding transcription regulator n=1 Tax=Phyllobacterium pellucidum TaxID=2740464 RepID=UPI001D14D3C6|nr:DeoR/GlpR family DNA-binding transcription regulator [Phyllobacterium sp. T1018]UGY10735.1 DeoR/GlpR family DNA-binding transcription regulator [Phyllobacterium sp. T1018]